MWLKLAGSLLVILSGTVLGFQWARRYQDRPRQIAQIISYLASLKSHINYALLPLPEALEKSAAGIPGPIADFFLQVSLKLRQTGWITPAEAINEVLHASENKLALADPEQDILRIFGANLGQVNREEQYKLIIVVEAEMQKIWQEAVQDRDKNVKMYQYLGICGSLALVILLL